jgi:RNA polymerase sigma factor (sigma-70 family)
MEVSALSHPSSATGLRGPSALLRLQSDERLIALTRRGQHAAFETLCARYQSRLLSFCRHMLNSREDAEDVLQEVFTAAFNAVLADQREINVRPWLYRIARNRSLNHLRRASSVGVDSMDIHFAEQGISTSDKVLRRESFRELIADVHELPETQRTALLLREIDALSYEQIAHAMETTVPSVKSLLVRARISLAEAAEARKLSCGEVRLELGEVAEGLTKLSTPARRHVRGCERCAGFKRQLKQNNHALAAIFPVAPLLIFKKLLLAKLGSAHVAGGASAGASATAGAAATVGAGAAATGGTGFAGGLVTAGAGALATKAVAGLAAAAIVTAGVAAADHGGAIRHHHHPHTVSSALASASSYAAAPVVVHELAQPTTASVAASPAVTGTALATRRKHHAKAVKPVKQSTIVVAAPVPATPVTTTPATPATPAQPSTQVTEVTTETTQLPSSATAPTSTTTAPTTSTGTEAPATTTTSTTPSAPAPSAPPPSTLPTVEAVPVPNPTPPASGDPKANSTQPAPSSATPNE